MPGIGKDKHLRERDAKMPYDRSLELRQLVAIVTVAALIISIVEVAAYIFFFA